jgi:hypothetical protein
VYTNPNVGQMLESVIGTLRREVLPHVQGAEATTRAEMCMAVLQWAHRLVPTEQHLYAEEAKEMSELFASLGSLLESEGSPEARRIQERARAMRAKAAKLGSAGYEALVAAHRELSAALIPTLDDLHALGPNARATQQGALAMMRKHLARRTRRDLEAYLGAPSGGAMVGRE